MSGAIKLGPSISTTPRTSSPATTCIHDAAVKGGSGSSGTTKNVSGEKCVAPAPDTVMASLRADTYEAPRPSPVSLTPPLPRTV